MIQTSEFRFQELQKINEASKRVSHIKLVPVKITDKITILIREGRDKAEAKDRFMQKQQAI